MSRNNHVSNPSPSNPSRTLKKLLVCCRGEIACRILKTAQEMGLQTAWVHSGADKGALPARYADETYDLLESHAKKSYLNQDAILEAARALGVDAIHPGYGFLSENAEFAKRVHAAGLIFVGPDAQIIAQMGHKAQAIASAKAANVPVIPGSDGVIDSIEQAIGIAEKIGYPLLIKAAAGGGGRGIRRADDPDGLRTGIIEAQREAQAAFGDGGVYLEKLITRARHIEVQILGDGQNVVHFFERDCSLQRRRQKIFEEACAWHLSDSVREALCQSAVRLGKAVGYRGAGTIEYLYDADSQQFYFIEMNTRIQVEHPISEMICGVDLIRTMLRIAAGEALAYQQSDITRHGHAIEVRINAENPDKNFLPSPGQISAIHWPQGAGIRVDTGVCSGSKVVPYYDSLIAKLIVWDETRPQALARLKWALDDCVVEGIATTLPFFKALLADPNIVSGDYHTHYLEETMATITRVPPANNVGTVALPVAKITEENPCQL